MQTRAVSRGAPDTALRLGGRFFHASFRPLCWFEWNTGNSADPSPVTDGSPTTRSPSNPYFLPAGPGDMITVYGRLHPGQFFDRDRLHSMKRQPLCASALFRLDY